MNDNPFSVPDSPPALIDRPNGGTKKILHVLAFIGILVVWYWSAVVESQSAADMLTGLHSIIIIKLAYGNSFSFNMPPSDFRLIFYVTESAFLALLAITVRLRSFNFTLTLLAFAFLWTLINFIMLIPSFGG